jgi:hypothetical protein
MIDRKKLVQRLNKGSRLKEFPLLNLYILVAAFFECLGQLLDSWLLKLLRPAPLLLMIFYLHSKNNARKHLVPSLVELALFFFLLDALAAFAEDPPNPLSTGLRALAHLVYCLALGIGEPVRLLYELRQVRRLGYVAILGATGGALYLLYEHLPNRVISAVYLSLLSGQLWVSLWRYEITLRSSFLFSVCGSGLLLAGGWVGLWAGGAGVALVQLLSECGHYFLMHGCLHQSNLQF